jgi:hypothetical protein
MRRKLRVFAPPSERDRFPGTETKSLAISEEAKKIAWKAQQRLHKRYKAMSARGKNKTRS